MFNVTPIPAFTDNYIWVISIEGSSSVAVVDPGDALAVTTYLNAHNLSLEAILITHHHNDHTGGVDDLIKQYNVPVYGPAESPFKDITHPLSDKDQFQLFNHTLFIREIPGHTLDHISYYSEQVQPQLFCGDTLFLAGCGRLFEGTAKQMLEAMHYFSSLPDNTEIYCTHEYSLANLSFASAVEPDNTHIQQSISQCKARRGNNLPTLPTTIVQEKKINPFMRTLEQSVITAASHFSEKQLSSEVETFAAIREWKNQF